MIRIVDTNVVLVANGQHREVSPDCVAACALALQKLMQTGKVAIDDNFEILSEYQNKTRPNTGNRPGDAFLKWLLQNKANPQRCEAVPIQRNRQRGYDSFPADEQLSGFDHSDRKFVAVAAAHPMHPPILQAADSKWLGWAPTLKAHGIEVEFLCRDDIKKFRGGKTRK